MLFVIKVWTTKVGGRAVPRDSNPAVAVIKVAGPAPIREAVNKTRAWLREVFTSSDVATEVELLTVTDGLNNGYGVLNCRPYALYDAAAPGWRLKKRGA